MLYALPPATNDREPAEAPSPTSVATQAAPTIVQTVTIAPISSRTDLLADVDEWTWSELRDYVVAQIESRFGVFPRDAKKEYGIFSRFLKEHGRVGIAVARYAFDICDGWWGNAPISINRFARGSDPYFAVPIIERLADVGSPQ